MRVIGRGAEEGQSYPQLEFETRSACLLTEQGLGGPARARTRVTTLHDERLIRIPLAGRGAWEQAARESA